MLLPGCFSTLRLGDPHGIRLLAAPATGALEIAWDQLLPERRPDRTRAALPAPDTFVRPFP